jgi:hypothetical protein
MKERHKQRRKCGKRQSGDMTAGGIRLERGGFALNVHVNERGHI